MKTRNFILGFLGIFTLAWAVNALWLSPLTGDTPWVLRKNAIYLSGILAMALMSLSMLLATRPNKLEAAFGGMDKIYHVHKWSGIFAILFGLAHWLIKLSGSQINAIYGNAGKPARDAVLFFMTDMRGLGKDLGEWSIYLLLALLAIALIKKIPYRPWRLLHKIMPALYLALVVHALALTPMDYWLGVSGALIFIMLLVGSICSIYVLTQQIGKSNTYTATVNNINVINDNILEIKCTVDSKWPGHMAGQFAFVKFDKQEGSHPFTIASAYDKNTSAIEFKIKGLGDYTKDLANTLLIGQTIEIEGPYGRFSYQPKSSGAAQIWVAAGIGITPFIAWLEDMQGKQTIQEIDMHYCVRNASTDKLVAEVKELCANLPNVNLFIHDETSQQRLDAELISSCSNTDSKNFDVWFCGPNKFAEALKQGFNKPYFNEINFHQEIFEMR